MADYKIDKPFGRNVSDPNFKINTSINNWALRSIQRLNEKAGGLVYNNNHPFLANATKEFTLTKGIDEDMEKIK